MTRGRNICNQLKEVRKRIAEENGIPLEVEDCTYQGECRGTCPRCEAEVQYLEDTLASRLKLGKAATVAGIALALGGTVQATEYETCGSPESPLNFTEKIHVANSILIKGAVVDSETGEPLPFVTITIADSNGTTIVARSDFDGLFSASVPQGKYTLTVNAVGYAHYVVLEDIYNENRTLPTIRLERTDPLMEEGVVGVEAEEHPVLEIGPNGASQYLEKDGVKVIVR